MKGERDENIKKILHCYAADLVMGVGAGAVAVGAGMVYLPAGLIAGGALAIAGAVLIMLGGENT